MSAACDGYRPSGPTGPTTSDRGVISGTVYEYGTFGRKPLPNAPIDVSQFWDYLIPLGVTDADGRYSASGSRGLEYKVRVEAPGYHQPCYAGAIVSASATLDAHVVSDSTLTSTGIPASMPLVEAVISGRVFESTAQEERPIPGATVIADFADYDWSNNPTPAATTLTDALGRYVLCGVRSGIRVLVSATGYRDNWSLVNLNATATYDFKLISAIGH